MEQQATTGSWRLTPRPSEARRFRLPDAYTGVLTTTMRWTTDAVVRQLVAAGRALDQVADVFGTGGGVSWSAYGSDMVEGLAEGNRAMFLNLLATDWFPAIPESTADCPRIHRRAWPISVAGPAGPRFDRACLP